MSFNEAFRALSDPTRREILRILSRGECAAGELSRQFDMSKPSVSHHFSVLKEADLIRSRRDGQRIVYSLNTTVAEDVMAWMWNLFVKKDTADTKPDLEPRGEGP
jgi:ArsR family transcriptional regulator, arsenate/arsenite/antimonite-responsive transcriptional repressor